MQILQNGQTGLNMASCAKQWWCNSLISYLRSQPGLVRNATNLNYTVSTFMHLLMVIEYIDLFRC